MSNINIKHKTYIFIKLIKNVKVNKNVKARMLLGVNAMHNEMSFDSEQLADSGVLLLYTKLCLPVQ